MKKSLSLLVMTLLAFAILPMVLADGAEIDIGGGVIVAPSCHDSQIFIDHTARGWFPNDQTKYTAGAYGTLEADGKYQCFNATTDYDRYLLDERMNYVFTGETVDYYVLARDLGGKADVSSVQVTVDGVGAGACRKVEQTDCAVNFSAAAFGVNSIDALTDQVYICKLIVPSTMKGQKQVSVKAVESCRATAGETVSNEADLTYFNPALSLELTGPSSVNFGNVVPGSVATSNSIYLKNVGGNATGVVMDVYIASDDYFTDPSNANAICPTGNGIKYSQFSYYATKGSLNSGANNADFQGLGAGDGTPDFNVAEICNAREDEFTVLPSHSGDIKDMCRVINSKRGASFLTEGAEMSITFRLNVPDPCVGNFNNGKFHFAGRVV